MKEVIYLKTIKNYKIYPFIKIENNNSNSNIIKRHELEQYLEHSKTLSYRESQEDLEIYKDDLEQGSILIITPRGLHLDIKDLPNLSTVVIELKLSTVNRLLEYYLELESKLVENDFDKELTLVLQLPTNQPYLDNKKAVDIFLNTKPFKFITKLSLNFDIFVSLKIPEYITTIGLLVTGDTLEDTGNIHIYPITLKKLIIIYSRESIYLLDNYKEILERILEKAKVSSLLISKDFQIDISKHIPNVQYVFSSKEGFTKQIDKDKKTIYIETLSQTNNVEQIADNYVVFSSLESLELDNNSYVFILEEDNSLIDYQEITIQNNIYYIKDSNPYILISTLF